MTTVIDAVRAHAHAPSALQATPVRVALLGVGQVGGAVATLVGESPLARRFEVCSGLVRDTTRPRPGSTNLHLTADPRVALDGRPDIVIEALGGLEPARTLVLNAIEQRIPVVTANKSLLAAHGEALIDAAAQAGVPLRYEAAVLAGVPFLGTFARRSLARAVTGFCGVVNGTTNFILTRMAEDRSAFADALADAQRRGYAEPDPAHDVNGIDAAEKLCVLLRHFADWSASPASVERNGIGSIEAADLSAAAEFGGALKPVVSADWLDGTLSAFAGPAFVFSSHPLARVNDVQNGIVLQNHAAGELFFAGPGAGPAVTAATLLDDAAEVADEGFVRLPGDCRAWKRARPVPPLTGWFVRVAGAALPNAADIADLFSAYGVWLRRSSEPRGDGPRQAWLLTHPCAQSKIEAALKALGHAAGCRTFRVRVLES